MSVTSGNVAELRFNNTKVAKCTAWERSENVESLETTNVAQWDETCIMGRRGSTVSATVLYDPSDSATAALLNSIKEDTMIENNVGLVLHKDLDIQESLTGFITNVSPSVKVGNTQACRISFVESDTSSSIKITGPEEVILGTATLYTSEIEGIGTTGVTYLWVAAGATFDDPTLQNPTVTFTGLGVRTLRVTAIIGNTVLEDTIEVTVTADPYVWTMRLKEPVTGFVYARCVYDEVNEVGYWASCVFPLSNAPSYILVVKTNNKGERLGVWRFQPAGGTTSFAFNVVSMSIDSRNSNVFIAVGDLTNGEESAARYYIRMTPAGTLVNVSKTISSSFRTQISYPQLTQDGKYIYGLMYASSGYGIAFLPNEVGPQSGYLFRGSVGFTDSFDLVVLSNGNILAHAQRNSGFYVWVFAPNFGSDPLTLPETLTKKIYSSGEVFVILDAPNGYVGFGDFREIIKFDSNFTITEYYRFPNGFQWFGPHSASRHRGTPGLFKDNLTVLTSYRVEINSAYGLGQSINIDNDNINNIAVTFNSDFTGFVTYDAFTQSRNVRTNNSAYNYYGSDGTILGTIHANNTVTDSRYSLVLTYRQIGRPNDTENINPVEDDNALSNYNLTVLKEAPPSNPGVNDFTVLSTPTTLDLIDSLTRITDSNLAVTDETSTYEIVDVSSSIQWEDDFIYPVV
jgi:hypothetical protein